MEKTFLDNAEDLKQQLLELNSGVKEKLKLKIFFLAYTFFVVFLLIINNTGLADKISLSITDALTFVLYFYLPILFANKIKNYYKDILITVFLIFTATYLFKVNGNFIFIFLYIIASLYFLKILLKTKNNIFNFRKNFLGDIFWGIFLAGGITLHILFSLSLTGNLTFKYVSLNVTFCFYLIIRNVFLNALGEEFFYRYFLLNLFLKQKWSLGKSIFISSLIYTLKYTFKSNFLTSPEIFMGAAYYIFIFGIFSGIVYLRTKSLIASLTANIVLSVIGDLFVLS